MTGFYKFDGFLIGPVNHIYNANYEFHIENLNQYTLPHDGWYYFENEEDAKNFFGIEEETDESL